MTSFIAWCSDLCLTQWSKERNSLVSTYLWGWRQYCQLFMRNWQRFTASLVLQIVMWRYRDAKEPLIPEQGKTNYFLMITPVLTKPGHCVPSRRAKCPCFHPHTLQSRFKVFFLSFFFPCDEAETGREEDFNAYMVCQHLSFQSSWIFPLIIVPEGM